MSLNVSSVGYPYAIGTIGCQAIGATVEIAPNSSLQTIYDAYKEIFSQYNAMHTALVGQLDTVLELFGGGVSYNNRGELNLEKIFDDNTLIDTLALKAGECKEGAKAYKYYLKDIIMQLNSLFSWNEKAKALLEQLKALIEHQSQEHDAEAHYLISQLDIADKHAQEAIKAFTEHAVSKDLTVTKLVVYNDGISGKIDRSTENYQTYEAEYDGVLTKSGSGYEYTPKVSNSYGSLEDLRALTTEKFTVTRTITTTCYKDKTKEHLADKYDDLAYREMETQEPSSSSTTSAIALFDELPLLDKLKYIVLYYKVNDKRYVFPEDAKMGFPCIQPTTSTSPIEDTNEIGQLEMFYIGYLVDRDGPVNALASFMEIKSVAIKAQINLLSYRIKALQYYINLLNKGLEKLNESQSSEMDPIPIVSYNTLRYLGANITRSLLYLKDADGNFLKDGKGKPLTNPYLVIQYQGNTPGTGDDGYEREDKNLPYHLTKKNRYLVIEASENGINSFLNWALKTDYEEAAEATIDLDNFFSEDGYEIKEKVIENSNLELGSEITYDSIRITESKELTKAIGQNLVEKYKSEGILKEKKEIIYTDKSGKKRTVDVTGKVVTIENQKIKIDSDEPIEFQKDEGITETTTVEYKKDTSTDQSQDMVYSNKKDVVTKVFYFDNTINAPDHVFFLEFLPTASGGAVTFSKTYLPKELEVSRLDVSSIVKDDYGKAGLSWKTGCKGYKQTWQTLMSAWTTSYDTSIANEQSQLEYVQKTITSLRKKIDTFDSMSSNFRSKAYTIYNRIVNKIS